MKQASFQIVHYVPNLFLGGRVPVAAVVLQGEKPHVVRAEYHPDERCLGGYVHLLALQHALTRLEQEPQFASTAALGPHLAFDSPRPLPQGVEAAPWLRQHVLPRAASADGTRGPKRASYGFKWLDEHGVARLVKKRFRPEKADVPKVPELEEKGLKPVSHWTSDGDRVLLLEPIMPTDGPQTAMHDVATVFGAYRFHSRNTDRVKLAAYMLEGGSDASREFTRIHLAAAAHKVFDVQRDDDRENLIESIRELGGHGPLLADAR